MRVTAKIKNLRISPRKVRLVTSLIKGMDVNDAFVQLESTVKKSSHDVKKLLQSAVANAENNWGLDRDNLYVEKIQVGEGVRLKRWLPRAYGRATKIIRRTSRIDITLEERIEGKNRKSKEQLAKERKAREEKKKKMEKELKAEREKMNKTEKTVEEKLLREKSRDQEQKKRGEKGWMKKIFQRKSG